MSSWTQLFTLMKWNFLSLVLFHVLISSFSDINMALLWLVLASYIYFPSFTFSLFVSLQLMWLGLAFSPTWQFLPFIGIEQLYLTWLLLLSGLNWPSYCLYSTWDCSFVPLFPSFLVFFWIKWVLSMIPFYLFFFLLINYNFCYVISVAALRFNLPQFTLKWYTTLCIG